MCSDNLRWDSVVRSDNLLVHFDDSLVHSGTWRFDQQGSSGNLQEHSGSLLGNSGNLQENSGGLLGCSGNSQETSDNSQMYSSNL